MHIKYEATDVDTGFKNIEFRFQNQFGNSISIYDYDQDTLASKKIDKNQLNGEYLLKTIQLSDDAYSSNRLSIETTEQRNFMIT